MSNNPLLDILNRISALERRVAGMLRHGTVAEVNAAEGWVRLDLGEGDNGKLLSPKVPYGQFAGALKVHTPPSVGQTMTLVSPGGDTRQAVALPMTWSNQNASPSQSGEENVLTYGDATVELRGGEIVVSVPRLLIQCDGTTLELTGGGLKAVAPDYQWD